MTPGLKLPDNDSHDWHAQGTFSFKLLSHHLDAFGARVMLLIKDYPARDPTAHTSHILSPEQMRMVANLFKIAADEAEASERRAQRHIRLINKIF